MSCDELTLKATDWPTEILRVVGVKARPLVVIVPAGPEGAVVVVVVGATVVAGAAVVTGATVVAGAAVVTGATVVVAGAQGLAT
jgi:hypothetical protein